MFNSKRFPCGFRQQCGFTLIELMIVVGIVGLLAAIAIPAYQDYTYRAKVTEIVALMARDKVVVSEYYSSHGNWPASSDKPGISVKESSRYLTADPVIDSDPRSIAYSIELSPSVKGDLVFKACFIESVIYDWWCEPGENTGLIDPRLPTYCRSTTENKCAEIDED